MSEEDMKWFVYIDVAYYAQARVVEADTAEEAVQIALKERDGNTYAHYHDDELIDGHGSTPEAVPACAVMPFDAVKFIGTENRIKSLIDPEWIWNYERPA